MPGKKIQTVTLTTHTTHLGDECVRRSPRFMDTARAGADVIRLLNGNPEDSDLSITVRLSDPRAADLFSPVPAPEVELDPGQSVDWTIKAVLAGDRAVKYGTDPDNCDGHDQDDIIVRC